jgi:hypothetical protein
MPASTWAFARDYYPYMRFGLAFTLMHDGYFSHELGDTDHGQDWWYDELDTKLGEPLGPAQRIVLHLGEVRDLLDNGGFEAELKDTWRLWCDAKGGNAAAAERDTDVKHAGAAAARITIAAAGRQGGIEFTQPNRALEAGKSYDLAFWVRAERSMELHVAASKGSPNWDNYGLSRTVRLSPEWQPVKVTFDAKKTVADSRIQFLFGGATGKVWIDEVSLKRHPEEVFRRDFRAGAVLLNGTRQRQTVDVGEGYSRLAGPQAPRHQYLLDDEAQDVFKATGTWRGVPLGTKEWHAIPPYFHAWNDRCHLLESGPGEATWDLAMRGPGTYTIQAWWAAAPDAKQWTHAAVYEVVAGGKVVATKTMDQTQAGDEWHTIAEGLKLDPADKPLVRLRASDGGILVADALHVFSAERYNDGRPVRQVTLEPMDGIVLRKDAQ